MSFATENSFARAVGHEFKSKIVFTKQMQEIYNEFQEPPPFTRERHFGDKWRRWTVFDLRYDAEPGTIIKREDKFMYLRNNRGERVTMNVPGYNYYVIVHENLSFFRVACFKSLLLALHFAYSKQSVKGRMRNLLSLDFGTVNHSYKILQPLLSAIADDEHNRLTGAVETPATEEEFEITDSIPELPTDETVYVEFANNLDRNMHPPAVVDQNWGSKSNSVGTIETFPGEEIFLRTSKRNIPFSYVSECVDRHGFCPLVTRFVKSGAVKSNGKLRNIFPMNITYENALRRKIDVSEINLSKGHEIVEGNSIPTCCLNYYDIKDCDQRLYPYIIRYAKERNITNLLIPLVNTPSVRDPLRFGYPAKQFPSGVYHTSLVTRAFTSALFYSLGCRHGHVQGDGYACSCPTPHEHEFIRRCDDFNGFEWRDGKIRYTRSSRLLEFKYCRGNGPKGLNRFVITRSAYNILDHLHECDIKITCPNKVKGYGYSSCRKCKMLVEGDFHLNQLSDEAVVIAASKCFQNLGRIVALAAQQVGVKFDTRTNSWDCCPTKELKVSRRKSADKRNYFPRFRLE